MCNMKTKKIILLFFISMLTLLLSSCKKNILINEVVNRNVNYEENISILDFEDALVEATKIAKESSIGLRVKAESSLIAAESFGSAVIIKRTKIANDKYEYYALTNRHVVLTSGGNKRSVFVTFPNAEEIKAQIVTYNSSIDVAIIKFESGRILSCAKVQLENVDEGRFVIAVGNPYDIDKYYNSVTIGNISYTNRIINEKDLEEKEISNIYIQHTASLNSGSSGGGLYNIKGELIGLNTWKIASEEVEGMNFSIPMSEIYNKYKEYFD